MKHSTQLSGFRLFRRRRSVLNHLSSEELRKFSDKDPHSPSLRSFVIVESLQWLFTFLGLFLAWRFAVGFGEQVLSTLQYVFSVPFLYDLLGELRSFLKYFF